MALSGKVSIITGASSGLGQATAVMFARKGAMITLCGRDSDRLKAVLDQCTQASGGHQERFITVQGDVTKASVRHDIVDKTIQKFGCLDVLVPNAGTSVPNSDLRNATEEIFDKIFDINLKSIFFLIQTALPALEKSKGNIIVTSSLLSTLVASPSLLYPMSKAAVDHMIRCMALDLGPKGIRVNAVNPSFIPTRLLRASFGDGVKEGAQSFAETQKSVQPLEGKGGEADDVASAICFLASDESKFITGECLKVDGGRGFAGPFQ